jgi:transcription elongation GreA/GreB family factor
MAARRDCDLPTTLYTTPRGLERLRTRLAQARAAYFAVCDSNGEAADAGDSSVWHDNFAYEENQRQMHQLARRVRELETSIERVTVVPASQEAPEAVQLGCAVRVRFDDGDEEQTWFLAGWADGEPARGRISYLSPLGRALVGARVGESRPLVIAGERRELEILEILAAPAGEVRS